MIPSLMKIAIAAAIMGLCTNLKTEIVSPMDISFLTIGFSLIKSGQP